MDRRRSATLFLIPALIMGAVLATQAFTPKQGPAQEEHQDAEPSRAATEAPADSAPATAAPPAVDPAARLAAEQRPTIETDHFVATFTSLNTALVSLEVKDERYAEEGKSHDLVTTDKERYLPLAFSVTGYEVPAGAAWKVVRPDPKTVEFTWQGAGYSITRRWQAPEGKTYQLLSTIDVTNDGTTERPAQLSVTSAHYVTREEEKGGFFGRPSPQMSHGICQQAGDTIREDRDELTEERITAGPEVSFVALTNVYFGTIFAPSLGTAEACELVATDRGGTIKDPAGSLFEGTLRYASQTIAPGETASFGTAVYVGPKNTKALEAFGRDATEVIDLGWFSFIARGMNWLLGQIFSFVGNWGFAIIILTVIVRVLLMPFVIPQFRNMAKQRALKPEIDRINELYKDDREKKGAAMMELWRKEKVNPLGGCLPVLLQMPIFFALYQSLSTNIELYRAPFIWWWSDLSSPDPMYVLPIVLGLLMILQQKLTPIAMDPMQAKVMMWVMPAMMTFFMLLLPTGLCLYMVTSSALGITQQRYMYWKMDKEAAALQSKRETENDTEPSDEDPPTLQPATESAPGTRARAKARRKKRPRRGRA